jgi:hypothetical protein
MRLPIQLMLHREMIEIFFRKPAAVVIACADKEYIMHFFSYFIEAAKKAI